MPNHAFNLTRDGDLLPAHLRGLPASSWWCECASLAEFFERARREQARMSTSTIGKSVSLVLAKDTERIERRYVTPAEVEAHR